MEDPQPPPTETVTIEDLLRDLKPLDAEAEARFLSSLGSHPDAGEEPGDSMDFVEALYLRFGAGRATGGQASPGMIDAARRASSKPLYRAARTARRIMLDAGCTGEEIADYVRRNYFIVEPFDRWPTKD
jgi:hypothetical protein